MTCGFIDKLTNNTDSCRHYNHDDYRTGAFLLVFFTFIIIGGAYAIDNSIKTWDAIQPTEHIVVAVVLDDGYSECVFVIDGKRIQTNLNPCKYAVDDVIQLKTDGNSVRTLGAIYDD